MTNGSHLNKESREKGLSSLRCQGSQIKKKSGISIEQVVYAGQEVRDLN